MTTNLWDAATPRLDALQAGHVTATTTNALREQVKRARETSATAQAILQALAANTDLSRDGKKSRAQAVIANTQATLEDAQAEINKAINKERSFHEDRAAWPRSQGTDADREARLANARNDLSRLLDGVPAGKRADRVAFAARTGTPAMQELILGERFAERVAWPSLPDGQADAAAWAGERIKLLQDLHPAGRPARDSLTALQTLGGAASQVETISRHAATFDLKALEDELGSLT